MKMKVLNMIEKLKKLFKIEQIKNRTINPNTIRIAVLKNSWIKEEFYNEYLENEKLFNNSFLKFLLSKIYDIKLKKCKYCGNLIHYNGTMANADYCSNKCKLIKEENPFSRPDIKKKLKDTWIEKYGVDNPAKSDIVKEKTKQTCLKKYGENILNPGLLPENIEKSKQSQIKKYGDLYSRTNEYKTRVKNTNQKLYGSKHKLQTKAWTHINSLEEVIPLFTFIDFQNTSRKDDYMRWKCKFCGNEFYAKYHNGDLSKKCECQHIRLSDIGSTGEYEIIDFIKTINKDLNIEHHSKFIPNLYEVDIVIPELKLAIEYNGVYWHSVKFRGGLYHLNKTELCEKAGFHLLHIWEDEWKNDNEKIKEKLKNIILNNKEEFTEDELKLDRFWYKNENIDGYILERIDPPTIIEKMNNKIENCGYLIYKKIC